LGKTSYEAITIGMAHFVFIQLNLQNELNQNFTLLLFPHEISHTCFLQLSVNIIEKLDKIIAIS
jgi:hypothetical protein